MVDYFPGRIYIGGTINPKTVDMDDLNRLAYFLNALGPDYAGSEPLHNVDGTDPMSFLKAVDRQKGVIVCEDCQACRGQFDDIEDVCRQMGLSYDRWSDSSGEYEGEYQRFRPGMKDPFTVEANNNGNQICDRLLVLEAYELLNQNNVKAARAALMKTLYTGGEAPVEPAPLPPFKVEA